MMVQERLPHAARVLILVSLVNSIAHAQTGAETLQSAWNTALRVDHQVQAAQRITESADHGVAAASATRLPSIAVQTSYTTLNNTPEVLFQLPTSSPGSPLGQSIRQPIANQRFMLSNVTVTVPVFTSGQIRDTVEAARAARNAARGDEDRTVLDVKLHVAEAYVAVLRAQQALQVAQSSVVSLRSFAADVQHVYDEGMVPRNDVLAAQVALADARQREIQARNGLDVARATYNRLLGRPLTDPVVLEEITPEPPLADVDAAMQQALRRRPELTALAEQAEAFRKQASSVRATQLPQLAATGGHVFVQNEVLVHRGVWSASVGVRWDLFDGGAARSQARSLDQRAEAVRAHRADAVSAVELQVRQAWLATHETAQRIAVTQDALAQAEENLTVSRDRYVEGLGTNTEALDAETLRVLSLSNYYEAMYDAVLARMRLHRAIGDL